MEPQDVRAVLVAENVYRAYGDTIAERISNALAYEEGTEAELRALLQCGARLMLDYEPVSSQKFDATLSAIAKRDELEARYDLVTEPRRAFCGYVATNEMQAWEAIAKRATPNAKMAAFAAEVEAWAATQ